MHATQRTGNMDDILWLGTIGFPTDELEESTKQQIAKKLESKYHVSDNDFDRHYVHYCKTILWPVLHYQMPDHPKSKAYEDHFLSTCSSLLAVEATTAEGIQIDDHFVNVISLAIGIDPHGLRLAHSDPQVLDWINIMMDRYKGKQPLDTRGHWMFEFIDHIADMKEFEIYQGSTNTNRRGHNDRPGRLRILIQDQIIYKLKEKDKAYIKPVPLPAITGKSGVRQKVR